MVAEAWSENVYVVHLADEPAFSDELDQLERRCEQNPRHAVIDMAAVTFVNSSNFSQLLRLHRQLGQTNCRVVLAAVAPDVWKAFLVAGLDKIFPRAESVPLALASLQLSGAATQE